MPPYRNCTAKWTKNAENVHLRRNMRKGFLSEIIQISKLFSHKVSYMAIIFIQFTQHVKNTCKITMEVDIMIS